MTDISPLVRHHIDRLFPPQEREEVARLLKEDCGAVLPGTGKMSPDSFMRIHCAALKLSEGRIDKLYDAVALAQTDWRDLLVSAGFAEDTQAHINWQE